MGKDPTLDYYEENARAFARSTREADMSLARQAFLSRIPAGGRILDFGCGSGRDIKAFLDLGYAAEASDGSPALCREASAYTGLEVRCMRFEDLDAEEAYDGIWACASILHLKKEVLGKVFASMARALKGEGVLYASFKYGTFEGLRRGRHFTDFTEETFAAFLASVPLFETEETWISRDVRPGRDGEKWLNVLLRKKGEGHAREQTEGDAVTVREMQEILKKNAGHITGTERIRVPEAVGFVLAAQITARIPNPPFPVTIEEGGRTRSVQRGAFWKAGEALLPAGRMLGTPEIAILSENGSDQVLVRRQIRTAILSLTGGDAAPGEDLPAGKCYDSSYPVMQADLTRIGARVIHLGLVEDALTDAEDRIRIGMEQADLILIARRCRKGQADPMERVFEMLGARTLGACRPLREGSSFLAALCRDRLLLVLPGEPVGTFLALHLLVRETMASMTGIPSLALWPGQAILLESCPSEPEEETYVPAFCRGTTVLPVSPHRSAASAWSGSPVNCLIRVPADRGGLRKGEAADLLLLHALI